MVLISERARILFIIIATFNTKAIFATDRETVEIIEKYGYPAETHTTESADGYHLTLHRIPHGKNSTKPGFPILAAHGIFSDSSQFVRDGSNSLGFFLADKGYDVWLINFRGTRYTRAHKYLSTSDSKFWDFSLHEHGIYDLPAYVDYICNHTKNNELFYLGYSMGTTAFSVLGSERPEYQKHIRGAALLAPVATMKYSKFPLKVIAAFGSILKVLSDVYSHGEFQIDPDAYQKFVELTCPSNSLISKFCKRAFYVLTAGELARFDKEPFDRFLNHYPSSTSTKVLVHYSQLINSGKFRQYDYGILQNLVMYNHKLPPEYHLEAITVPISLFVAPDDILATPKGVKETLTALPSVQTIYVVPDLHFGHGNSISGEEYKDVLYPEIARQIENILRGSNAPQELSLINHFKKVPGIDNYHTENYHNYTPIQVHGSERDLLEHSFINNFKKVYANDNHPMEDSFDNAPAQAGGSEKVPEEHPFINKLKKTYGNDNHPVEDSFISAPAHVRGIPEEHSFTNTHKTIHRSDNDEADFFKHRHRKAHNRKNDHARHSLINNFSHGKKNDPEEHYTTMLHYIY